MAAQRRKPKAPSASGPSQNEVNKIDGLYKSEDWRALESHARKLTARYPGNGFCWKALGIALASLGYSAEAVEAYTKAIEIDPKDYEALNNRGNAQRASGNIGAAVSSHVQAIALKPDYVDGYNCLGVTLKEMGHTKGAIDNYRNALSIAPNNIPALNNLAGILSQLGENDTALTYYRQILELAPDYADARFNLGNVLRDLNRLEEAKAEYRRVIELKPQFSSAYLNLSVPLIREGKLDECIAEIRNGLRHLMNDVHARQRAKPKKYMRQDPARQALQSMKHALDAEGVPFFLAYGTLLGIVRDGDLLPHDKDMDIGLPWDINREDLLNTLTTKYAFKEHNPTGRSGEDYQLSFSVSHPETNTAIDLFFFKPDGETLLSGFSHKPEPMLWRFTAFEIGQLTWLDEAWPAPESPETFLEEIYGPDWRVPDPNFDTVISAKNMEPRSLELAIAYGHGRLAERMNLREWEKALGYCGQLRALREDPFIDEVEAWLNTVIERQEEAA